MFTAKNKHAPRIAQLLGTALLLFVFFLPLHLHFSAAPQLGNECSCLCGTRTQIVLNDAAPRPAPALCSSTPIALLVEVHSFEPTKTHRVRGPPAMAGA